MLCVVSVVCESEGCNKSTEHCQIAQGRSNALHIDRVGQNCIYTPYMTVYLMISLPIPYIPYIHRIYMVLANPTH